MKDFIKNNSQIIILELIVIAVFFIFYGKFGNMFVDSFREAYIPWQMNEGQILYKDIFCIYPPLAYIINALLFKIFGANLNVLYISGLFCTMGILYFTCKIADNFLDRDMSFGICMFFIAGLLLSPNVFNAFFPYSYGILYGLFFILISIYCLLNKKYPLAYLFYSLAICSKYEFVLLLPLLIFVSKKTDWKMNLRALFIPPIITLAILILTGTTFQDIKTTLELITIMGQTKTLQFFYSYMGLIFHWELLPVYCINFIKFMIPINWSLYHLILIWIFPLISLLFIIRYKTISTKEKIFIIASVLISIKVFFALVIKSYGAYFIPFALISLGILTPQKLKKYFTILIIFWSLVIGFYNFKDLIKKDFTELNNVAEYISNTPKTSSIAVYPEGLGINFISKRKSDNGLYSLIPLYVETFGEDYIVKRLEYTKPQYIIISNFQTPDYYYKEFGNDYGQYIMEWIKNNYILEKKFENEYSFYVYKLNS